MIQPPETKTHIGQKMSQYVLGDPEQQRPSHLQQGLIQQQLKRIILQLDTLGTEPQDITMRQELQKRQQELILRQREARQAELGRKLTRRQTQILKQLSSADLEAEQLQQQSPVIRLEKQRRHRQEQRRRQQQEQQKQQLQQQDYNTYLKDDELSLYTIDVGSYDTSDKITFSILNRELTDMIARFSEKVHDFLTLQQSPQVTVEASVYELSLLYNNIFMNILSSINSITCEELSKVLQQLFISYQLLEQNEFYKRYKTSINQSNIIPFFFTNPYYDFSTNTLIPYELIPVCDLSSPNVLRISDYLAKLYASETRVKSLMILCFLIQTNSVPPLFKISYISYVLILLGKASVVFKERKLRRFVDFVENNLLFEGETLSETDPDNHEFIIRTVYLCSIYYEMQNCRTCHYDEDKECVFRSLTEHVHPLMSRLFTKEQFKYAHKVLKDANVKTAVFKVFEQIAQQTYPELIQQLAKPAKYDRSKLDQIKSKLDIDENKSTTSTDLTKLEPPEKIMIPTHKQRFKASFTSLCDYAKQYALENGYTLIEIGRDGDCLLRSIRIGCLLLDRNFRQIVTYSEQPYEFTQHIDRLRASICDYLQEGYDTSTILAIDSTTFHGQLQRLRKPGIFNVDLMDMVPQTFLRMNEFVKYSTQFGLLDVSIEGLIETREITESGMVQKPGVYLVHYPTLDEVSAHYDIMVLNDILDEEGVDQRSLKDLAMMDTTRRRR